MWNDEQEKLEQRVIGVVADIMSVEDRESITLKTSLESLGMDSLDAQELMMEVEEEFDIDIPEGSETNIRTVADLVKAVEEQQESG